MAENILDNAKVQEANMFLPTGSPAKDAKALWNSLLFRQVISYLKSYFSRKAEAIQSWKDIGNKKPGYAGKRDGFWDLSSVLDDMIRIFIEEVNNKGPEFAKKLHHASQRHSLTLPDDVRQAYYLDKYDGSFGANSRLAGPWPETIKEYEKVFKKFGIKPMDIDPEHIDLAKFSGLPGFNAEFLFKPKRGDKYSPVETAMDLHNRRFPKHSYYGLATWYDFMDRFLNGDPEIKDDSEELENHKSDIPMYMAGLARIFNRQKNEHNHAMEKYLEEPSFGFVTSDPLMALEGPFAKYFSEDLVHSMINGESPYFDENDRTPIESAEHNKTPYFYADDYNIMMRILKELEQ